MLETRDLGGEADILPSDLVAHSLCHTRGKDVDLWMQGYKCHESGSLEAELEIGVQIHVIY